MLMRQFVLNHASLVAERQADVVPLLRDVVGGMTMLLNKNVANPILRMYSENPQIQCPASLSLNDLIWSDALKKERDLRYFLIGVISKTSLLDNLEENYKDRFIGCEYLSSSSSVGRSISLTPDEGAPLVLCAVTDWIATGFATNDWDCEQIVVHFSELQDDSSIENVSELVDNLTRDSHASFIIRTHYSKIQSALSKDTFWDSKYSAFPSLKFGHDVKKHISNLQVRDLSPLIKKLASLDQSCEQWKNEDLDFPKFNCKVSKESESVRNSPNLYNLRVFASSDGSQKFFEWHARFGSSGRIHFRILEDIKNIEIGYVGPHLPTRKFP